MGGSINIYSEPTVGNLAQINLEAVIGEIPKVNLDLSYNEIGNKPYAQQIPSEYFKICEVENYQI